MYVITGATGHTGNVAAKELLAKGLEVRAIGRSEDRLQALKTAGAEPWVCDMTNAVKLTEAFRGAKAVYVMIPPDMTSNDFRADQDRVTEAVRSALEAAGVEYAVTLSSIGADKEKGTGPVASLHYLEERLNSLAGLNVVHLRTGYFMENTLAQIGIIRQLESMAGPLEPNLKLAMIATRDIGKVVAEEMAGLKFKGHQTRELQGQRDLTMTEMASIVGKAIHKPDLGYVRLQDDQVRAAMTGMGMSLHVANLILEASAALKSGHMRALEPRSARNTTPTRYETFVGEEFVPAMTAGAVH